MANEFKRQFEEYPAIGHWMTDEQRESFAKMAAADGIDVTDNSFGSIAVDAQYWFLNGWEAAKKSK